MGKLKSVPFAIQSGDHGITQNSRERLINMFAETESSGRAKVIRRQRDCLDSVYAVTGVKRCIEKHRGVHYVIIDATLSSFDGTTLSTLGTLGSSSGRCTMGFNDNDEILISDRQNLYYWNGSTLATVSLPGGVVPGDVSVLNGYGIFNNVGTGQFYITASDDFSAVDPLDFATAESSPDALQTTFTDHNEVWLPGTDTIEIWQDVGGTDFPFQAVTSAKIERGCAAPHSLAADDNTVILLGNDLIVYRFEGYRPARISSHALEEALRACSADEIAAAYAVIYSSGGNKFYTLIIEDVLTWQYNFATGLWNEAQTYGHDHWAILGSRGHYADYVLTAAGICSLSSDVNTDEGGIVVRKAISGPANADGKLIAVPEFRADCEVGHAPVDVSADVMLRFAPDGETFGNYKTRSLGATGAYSTRAVWRGLGQGRRPVIELSASADFRFVIIDTEFNASVGNS